MRDPVIVGTEITKCKNPRAEGSISLPTISVVSTAIKATKTPSKTPNNSVYKMSPVYVVASGNSVVVTAMMRKAVW